MITGPDLKNHRSAHQRHTYDTFIAVYVFTVVHYGYDHTHSCDVVGPHACDIDVMTHLVVVYLKREGGEGGVGGGVRGRKEERSGGERKMGIGKEQRDDSCEQGRK